MARKPPTEPAFEIVLSEEQLEHLGRFTAIVSQIDSMMFQAISLAGKIQTQNLMALIEGTTGGQRLAMLRRLAQNMPQDAARSKADDVCSGLSGLNDKRNHILHGTWGLNWDTEKIPSSPRALTNAIKPTRYLLVSCRSFATAPHFSRKKCENY